VFGWRKKTWDLSKSWDLERRKLEVHRLVKLVKNLKFYSKFVGFWPSKIPWYEMLFSKFRLKTSHIVIRVIFLNFYIQWEIAIEGI